MGPRGSNTSSGRPGLRARGRTYPLARALLPSSQTRRLGLPNERFFDPLGESGRGGTVEARRKNRGGGTAEERRKSGEREGGTAEER
eukprot:1447179-Pyramimonas_sp.AAC.1